MLGGGLSEGMLMSEGCGVVLYYSPMLEMRFLGLRVL